LQAAIIAVISSGIEIGIGRESLLRIIGQGLSEQHHVREVDDVHGLEGLKGVPAAAHI